jgi:hypothetical protein
MIIGSENEGAHMGNAPPNPYKGWNERSCHPPLATRSRVCPCYDWRNQDVTRCSATGALPGRAVGAI